VPPETMIEYGRTRDMKVIERYISPQDRPTFYYHRKLPRSVMDRYVDTQPSDEGKAVAAFQYGVYRVDNRREDDGARVNWEPSGSVQTRDGDIRTLTDAEMELFSRAEQIEIGNVVWNASFLPGWIERGYPLPPTSLALWARTASPSAVASLQMLVPSNSAPSGEGSPVSEPTAPGRESIGKGSAPVTGAIAAG
jgi:hypothetical protein